MGKLAIIILISLSLNADFMCQNAGEDVAEYSRAYESAMSEYEDADEGEEKQEAKEEMQRAKDNLKSASDDVFTHCESNTIEIMGELLREKNKIEKECEKTRRINEIFPPKLQRILEDTNLSMEEAKAIAEDIHQQYLDWFCNN